MWDEKIYILPEETVAANFGIGSRLPTPTCQEHRLLLFSAMLGVLMFGRLISASHLFYYEALFYQILVGLCIMTTTRQRFV